MPATMLIAQIVSASSVLGAGFGSCKAVAEVSSISFQCKMQLRFYFNPLTFTPHTIRNAATSGYTKRIEFQSTDGGRQGRRPRYREVFHSCPQVQSHRSSLRGDQPHRGQRMRGPDGSRLFSFSSSRSKTMDWSCEWAHMHRYYRPIRRME